MNLIFYVIALLCFLGVLIFGKNMDPLEAQRFIAGGLAAFVAGHFIWPANWGPGNRA